MVDGFPLVALHPVPGTWCSCDNITARCFFCCVCVSFCFVCFFLCFSSDSGKGREAPSTPFTQALFTVLLYHGSAIAAFSTQGGGGEGEEIRECGETRVSLILLSSLLSIPCRLMVRCGGTHTVRWHV